MKYNDKHVTGTNNFRFSQDLLNGSLDVGRTFGGAFLLVEAGEG